MAGNFFKATKKEEALKYMNENECKIIAGGTDLIIKMRQGKCNAQNIMDISSVEEFRNIEKKDGKIIIGCCCTHSQIEKNPIIKSEVPVLAKGCSLVGSTLIRNRGTIGGNIVNNSNAGDSIPPLFILDAKLNISKYGSLRTADIKSGTHIEDKEILTSIEVEPLKGYKWDIVKVERRKSLAISRLTLAIALKMNGNIIEDLRIYPGAMLSHNQRLYGTEMFAKGNVLSEHFIEEAAQKAILEVIGISGIRWSSEYKNPVLKGLIIRTLEGFM